MAKKQLTRTEMRAQAKTSMARQVKPWPMALELNVSRIKTLASGEWNFDKLYEQVRQFAGGSVTREVFQEFLKAKQIQIKTRPHGGWKAV